ncbi:hypothetical protein [Streptomyces sp. KN37]|uniref:hypothetical protein n=1 Tax=Streptomyces sp. KN37 TaxID=3090667 RepID=UPI002A74CD8E|nr:hypothetical protein [Streptomyces sp. KN37]WPO70212.1 hypothetical protein R9806_06005 [Streptomyces sp. KN37]
MPDVTVKLSDGIREITVEINDSDDDPLGRAEAAALRLYGVVNTGAFSDRPAGFNTWALSSDTERSPEES